MSSSISNSEPGAPVARDNATARLWLRWFAGALILTIGALYGGLILIDPYDAGRFWSLPIGGVADAGRRTAVASFARDPAYDTAIIGNSIGFQLHPARLSQATGLAVVQLALPATGPQEQLAVLDWFLRHHDRIGGLVVVADATWCDLDPAPALLHPFPFWLYGRSDAAYLGHLFNGPTLQHVAQRIGLGLGLLARTDPSGYCADCRVADPDARPVQFAPAPPFDPTPVAVRRDLAFPAIDRLDALLAAHEPAAPVVVVMPPAFVTVLPHRGSEAAVVMASCKARFAGLAADRPARRFIDLRRDGPLARDPQNFLDELHMRPAIVEMVEDAVAAALSSITSARNVSAAAP